MGIAAKFKKLGPKIFFQKVIGYEPVFACAVRKKGDRCLYDGETADKFQLVPIDQNCWYADPLFYEYNGRTFLFMEAWGYRTLKGVIVCVEILEDSITQPQIVLEEDYHISFPNIFEWNHELYMIPEVEGSGGINLYHAVYFPYKWERVTHIDTAFPLVDTIVESIEDNTLYLKASTFDRSSDMETCFWKFTLMLNTDGSVTYNDDDSPESLKQMSYENRYAGRLIKCTETTGKYCLQRSTQNIYGYSLKFRDAVRCGHRWQEQIGTDKEIIPESIQIENWNKRIIGTHTYSVSSKYEVIDIEYLRWSPMNWVRQIKKYI